MTMKKSILFVAIFAICAACSNRTKEEVEQDRFANFPSGKLEVANASGDTIGIVCGRFFSSERIDTLYCVALGASYYNSNLDTIPDYPDCDNKINNFLLTNDKKNLTPLYLLSFFYMNNLKIKDLDNDGRDEIGLVRNWWIGAWASYQIFDFYENEWNLLCRPISFFTGNCRDEETMDIVRASEKEGFLIAEEDEWKVENLVTEEVEIKIEREPLNYKGDTIYSIPGGKPIILPLPKGTRLRTN